MPKITPVDLLARKRERRKITMLSIYDYAMAILADRAGLDTILVGDSLAMTALGYPSTVALTLDEMLHHTSAVARGAKPAMVVADMPFMSYQLSEREAIRAAGRFLKEGGADAVKLEGGRRHRARRSAVHHAGVPVIGHVGLTPQNAAQLGGLKVQGKMPSAARGCWRMPWRSRRPGPSRSSSSASRARCAIITQRLRVPTISYGAGVHCDGQGMVSADMLGLFEQFTPALRQALCRSCRSDPRCVQELLRGGGGRKLPGRQAHVPHRPGRARPSWRRRASGVRARSLRQARFSQSVGPPGEMLGAANREPVGWLGSALFAWETRRRFGAMARSPRES